VRGREEETLASRPTPARLVAPRRQGAKNFIGGFAAAREVLALSWILAVVGCSDGKDCARSFSELGSAQDVCLVRSSTGAAACYSQPQICPNQQPVGFCSRFVGGGPTAFNLLLQNRGERPLTIRSIRVRGDERCAFTMPEISPRLGVPINPDDGMIVRFRYAPPEVGEDHAVFEIESDGENFPVLPIAVCGAGATSTTAAAMAECIQCQDRLQADFTSCWEL